LNKASRGGMFPALIAAALCALWAPCSAFALFQSVPSVIMEASAGFRAGGAEYSLLRLRIYHKARGLAAFPDGGIPKDAVDKVYLVKTGGNGFIRVAELAAPPGSSGVYLKSSKIRAEDKGLLIRFPWYDRKARTEKHGYYFFDPAADKITAAAEAGGNWPKETRSLGETNKALRDFSDFDGAGLPNPLDFTPGADKPEGLAGLISKGAGERRLRLAAARRLMGSGNGALLRAAVADLNKIAASRKLYFWGEEKALLEAILAGPGRKKGE